MPTCCEIYWPTKASRPWSSTTCCRAAPGVDIVGWPTAARVVVAEHDAPRARAIAVEFGPPRAAAAHENAEAEKTKPRPTLPAEPVREPAADWPVCPQCGGASGEITHARVRDGRHAISLGRHGFQRPVGPAQSAALDVSLRSGRLHIGRARIARFGRRARAARRIAAAMLICTM